MVWSRKAKLDFYWARRRAAKATYVKHAKTLGVSTKRAAKKAAKDVSRAYARRKEGYKKINKMSREIQKLSSKSDLTPRQQRKLEVLLSRQSTAIGKVNEQWLEFERQIEFKPIGADSERAQRQS